MQGSSGSPSRVGNPNNDDDDDDGDNDNDNNNNNKNLDQKRTLRDRTFSREFPTTSPHHAMLHRGYVA
jgi:hypothetical protein